MKRQKKWFVCLVGALVLSGVTGCSGAADEENFPTPEPTMNVEENSTSGKTQVGEIEQEDGTQLSEVEKKPDNLPSEESGQMPGDLQGGESGQMPENQSDGETVLESDELQDVDGVPVTDEPVAGNGEVDWFAAYNGEKLQRIVSEAPGTYSPSMCSDIIFYEAEDGESMEDIIHTMIDAMIQPLTEDTEERPFTITTYRLEEQAYKIYDEKVQGVWLLPYLNGYYSYTGVDFVEMETVMKEQPDLVHDGMVPFMRQGSEEAFVFVLMQEGNVYRLQRAQDMEACYVPE